MTTYKLAPLRLVSAMFTRLDACGVPSTSPCARFSYSSLVKIEQSGEVQERQEFPLINADGVMEEFEASEPQVKFLTVGIQMLKAVPELVSWMTGDGLILDDAVAPSAVGWKTEGSSSALANFSLIGWTRLAGMAGCPTTARYGLLVYPWLVGGVMHSATAENAVMELMVTARTKKNSPFGSSPYLLNVSKAPATLGQPMGLYTPVGADDHRHFQYTELAPPVATTDCRPVVEPLVVVDDDGAGAGLAATATLPVAATATPGFIDWGDLTVDPVLAGAPTAAHVYALAGTYTVTYMPSGQAGPMYVGSVTMA